MTEKELNEIKASAVKQFVNGIIDALHSGFIDHNRPNLAELHKVAQDHCEIALGVKTKGLVEEWGEDVAELCGLQKPKEG